MTKKFATYGILIIVLTGIIVPSSAFAACGPNEVPVPGAGGATVCMPKDKTVNGQTDGLGLAKSIWETIVKGIANILMSLSSVILFLSGLLFDFVIDLTIVNMAKHVGDNSGIGGSITTAWATLRDLANMCFIFVLLYAAFKNMFDTNFGGFGKIVKDIVIIALLINFSLFLSKVVIDASNIVSVGFYKSIASQSIEVPIKGKIEGISPGFMNMLGLQTLYGSKVLDGMTGGTEIFMTGILSSILMLVLAVIFLIVSVMFAARFIILIFLMILSPLAFIAYIIPGQKKQFDEWLDALKNQSFFAPLYFALTWVVFKLGTALIKSGVTKTSDGMELSQIANNPKSALGLVVNYVLIIGFSIAALVYSKKMASAGTVGGYFKSISGGIGTGVVGGVALAGRQSIGRGAKLLSESSRLRNLATEGKYGTQYLGRAALWGSSKTAKGSFDLRSSDTLKKVPGLGGELGVLGKGGGKGGFAQSVEEKAKRKAKYAKEVYGQTDAEKEEYEKAKEEEKKGIIDAREEKANQTKAEADLAENNRKKYMTDKLKDEQEALKEAEKRSKEKREEMAAARRGGREGDAFRLERELKELDLERSQAASAKQEKQKEMEENDEGYKRLKEIERDQRLVAQGAERQRRNKDVGEKEYSEETQALGSVGKKRQEQFAERIRESKLEKVGRVVASGGVGALAGGIALGPVGALGGAALTGLWGKILSDELGSTEGNKAAAREIIKQSKGKSKAEKLADLALEVEKERKAKEETSETPSVASVAPAPPPVTPPNTT